MENSLSSLVVEITNICNIKCKMCLKQTAWYKNYERNVPKVMDIELFKKIIDQYSEMESDGEKSVLLQFQGESLTLKNFFDYCDYVEDKKIKWGFTTNGTLLSKEITDKLVTYNCFHSIAFSIDGFSKEVFESIRINADRDVVYSNIDYFLKKSEKQRNNSKIGVSVNSVIMPENENEINNIIAHFLSKGIKNITASYVCDENIMPQETNFIPDRIPCKSITNSMIVLTNGKIVPCCRDSKYQLNLGNISEKSLEEIWNGHEYENLRRLHSFGKYTMISPCNNCLTWACGVNEEKHDSVKLEMGTLDVYKGSFYFRWSLKK